MPLTDSKDVTLPGFHVVGAVRKVLVGTSKGIFRIQGNLTYSSPWVREPVLDTRGAAVRDLARGPSGEVVVAALSGPEGGLRVSRNRGNAFCELEGWQARSSACSVCFLEEGSMLAGDAGGDIWAGSLDAKRWEANESVRALSLRPEWRGMEEGGAEMVRIVRDPHRPRRLLASVRRGGVLASEDAGRTWAQVSPLWEVWKAVYSLSNRILAATSQGLQVTEDRGRRWQRALPGMDTVPGLARDAGGQLFVAAVSDRAAVFLSSDDDGLTWAPIEGADDIPPPLPGRTCMVADKVRPGVFLYAAGDSIWLRDEAGLRSVISGLPEVRSMLVL